jgi:hypothetical protein
MDSYAPELQPAGGAFVMLAKGAAAGWSPTVRGAWRLLLG